MQDSTAQAGRVYVEVVMLVSLFSSGDVSHKKLTRNYCHTLYGLPATGNVDRGLYKVVLSFQLAQEFEWLGVLELD